MTEEVWRPLPSDRRYQISTLGRVRRFWNSGPRLVNPYLLKRGYLRFDAGYRARVMLHRAVLEAHVGLGVGLYALHNNGDRMDNRLSNLRWGTAKDNHNDAVKHGTRQRATGTSLFVKPQRSSDGNHKARNL